MHLNESSTSVAPAQQSTKLQAERCQCCPYGFHIDLDFVNFAQDVASGRKTVEPGSRRQTPVSFADAKKAKQQRLNGSSNREQTPPSAFRSISKRSLNDIVNDLNELTENSQTPIIIKDEQLGFSTLPSKISAKHVEWSPPISTFTATPPNDPEQAFKKEVIIQLNDLNNSGIYSDFRDTSKTPLTVSANEEVQHILEHQPRSRVTGRLITSAPTSPVSRTYYTAIGQSLAHLKDRTPVSKISSTDYSYTPTTMSTPRRSLLTSAQSTPFSHSTTNDSSAKPPLPRRYFDVQRRNRVLSPDPESSNASPNLLRSSNLQSRTYFKPTSTVTMNATTVSNGYSSTQSVPYRSRFSNNATSYSGSTGSPLFDSFASVKRSLGLSFVEDIPTVSSPLIHSYTPTPQHFQNAQSTYNAQNTQNAYNTQSLQSTQTQTPPIQMSNPKNFRDSPTQTPIPTRNSTSIESQTNQVYLKNVAVCTMPSEKRSIGTHILPSQNSVSLDTSDLLEPPAKRPFSVEFQYCIGHESEHLYEELPDIAPTRKHSKSTIATPQTTNAATLCRPLCVNNETQTDEDSEKTKSERTNSETQTSDDWLMVEVRAMMQAEKAERKSVDQKTETNESGEFILITCSRCQDPIDGEQYEKIVDEEPIQAQINVISQSSSPHTVTLKSSSSSSDQDEGLGLIEPLDFDLTDQQDRSQSEELDLPQFKTPSPRLQRAFGEDSKSLKSEKSLDDEEKEMLANLDHLANLDPDRFSLASVQTIICVPQPQDQEETPSRQLDPTKAEAIRKLLTEPQQTTSGFQRESSTNRSYRVEKKTLDLDYILDKHSATEKSPSTVSSTPSNDPEQALKEMVVLKKFISLPSTFLDPMQKIPRPKFSKFSHPVAEEAETPDEADEAVDKLTPLRSDLLDSWRTGPQYRRAFRHHQYPNFGSSTQEPTSYINAQSPTHDDTDEEDEINDPVSTSNSSITSLEEDASSNDGEVLDFEMTAPLKEALETLNKHLLENDTAEHSTDWAYKYVQHAWLQIATRKAASAGTIKKFIDALNALSPKILETVMNFVDQNGNSALHYSVSHENYEVIATLLDTKVCKVDETNKAGYSAIMLGSLCALKNETESAIIQRLFERGNVNAKAIYHGQTALMLSVSHGRIETTNLLLKLSADVNIQDIDGSTALMCASEHGHKELVKILLKRPGIDASLMDCDSQTALSIAVENGHRDIGVMIYGFLNHSRNEQHESNSL